ncbi:hypothetical protein R3P38DRAFT_2890444 [Favolaschia claudopus]|uniref:Uncharacterized protein n=1 Tax=Favolaschia claudopus TaxID=2862362 RepID=A0AAW0CUU9_9AGAR
MPRCRSLYSRGKELVRKVLCFRHYLRVSNEKHRRALTHILLSGHALASERMTWADRDRPEVGRRDGGCAGFSKSALKIQCTLFSAANTRPYWRSVACFITKFSRRCQR